MQHPACEHGVTQQQWRQGQARIVSVDQPSPRSTQGTIGIAVNLFTPDEVRLGQTGFDASFKSQVRMPEATKSGVSMGSSI